MLSSFGLLIHRFFGRIVPDPFAIAIYLTIITLFLAIFRLGFSDPSFDVLELIGYWSGSTGDFKDKGIWGLLGFSMLMSMILVTGFIVAEAPVIKSAIKKLASIPKNGKQGVLLVALFSMFAGLINWGFGLIGGAILAREVGLDMESRGKKIHYPLLVSAGYMGMLVWHGGFSGSAPITMTTVGGIREVLPDLAAVENTISLSETIFSPLNCIVTLGTIICIPLLLTWMCPPANLCLPSSKFISKNIIQKKCLSEKKSISDKLSENVCVGFFLGGIFLLGALRGVLIEGIDRISLTTIITIMFGLGMIFHGSPRSVMSAAGEAAKGCAGIMLLFPLYAGILVICKSSGIAESLTRFFIEIGNKETLPLFTYFSAALMNIFVPSGGGQWAIQGELALQAGAVHGIGAGRMLLSVAFGDQVTNMLQPFWALPLLSITGIKARDIVGYTAIVMFASIGWTVFVLYFF